MTRRNNARREFGAVEQLPSGRWRARYTGPDGRMRSAPVTFDTRREADAWLTGQRADILRGVWAPPDRARISLGTYAETWLRQRTPQLRPRTLDLYRRGIDRWLLQPVGSGRGAIELAPLNLNALTPSLIREWFAVVSAEAQRSASKRGGHDRQLHPARSWASDRGFDVKATGRLSPAILAAWERAGSPHVTPTQVARHGLGATAAAQAYRLLHAILAEAVNDDLIATNPARIPGAGHVAHAERFPLTPAEVAALAAAMPDRYRAAVLIGAWSGLRPGEVFALRRRDLDIGAGLVHIRRTLIELPGQAPSYGPPKTAASTRTVALPTFVADALRSHLARHVEPGLEALIFTTSTDAPVTSHARSKALARPRQAIGRPDITWHHLRHTGATLAAQAGATPAELQRRIGHTTTRAAALYQHASMERDALIANNLDQLGAR